MKRVLIEKHAIERLLSRSESFGIPYPDALQRVYQTINTKRRSIKHRSKKYAVFQRYFADNLSFYVVLKETEVLIVVKTIIIEKGR